MKRILSLVLTLLMLMSLAGMACAEGEPALEKDARYDLIDRF